jgi:hypothetical protein
MLFLQLIVSVGEHVWFRYQVHHPHTAPYSRYGAALNSRRPPHPARADVDLVQDKRCQGIIAFRRHLQLGYADIERRLDCLASGQSLIAAVQHSPGAGAQVTGPILRGGPDTGSAMIRE